MDMCGWWSMYTYQGVQLDRLVGSSPILVLGGVFPNPEVDVIEQFLYKHKCTEMHAQQHNCKDPNHHHYHHHHRHYSFAALSAALTSLSGFLYVLRMMYESPS